MSYKFGSSSLKILDTVNRYLALCAMETINKSKIDISIPEWGGLRDAEYQFSLYKKKWSKADGTNIKSKHQLVDDQGKSRALDLCAYHNGKQNWNTQRLSYIAGLMLSTFEELKGLEYYDSRQIPSDVYIHWGGFWQPVNKNSDDLGFDLPHFQIRTTPQTKVYV